MAMVTLFRAAANLPNGAAALFELFNDLDDQQLTRNEFLDALANRTGWNRGDLDFLTGPDGFDLQFPAGFADGQFLVRLKRCFELLTPLGVGAEEAWRWAEPAPDAVIARAIKQAVRAKLDDRQQWLAAARPIRDELRNEQRDALVARLLHFRFDNFYHPYVCLLVEQLNRHGIEGILKPDPEKEPTKERRDSVKELRRQRLSKAFFNADYAPNSDNVVNVYGKSHLSPLSQQEKDAAGPLDEFDFSYGGAYSIYNWELFFHAPFMLAKRLSANQRFAEAHRWFHYIFDPTYLALAEPWPERVWQIKPFFDHGVGKSIERFMRLLKSSGLSNAELDERKSLRDQIEAWRKTPFNPHLIARMRNEAYMKAVVMAYLDNLIAWGDHLFRQDTRESINEATQLYILAGEILGERPKQIPAHEGTRKTINGQEVKTFDQLKDHLDAFSNALIELETIVYPMDADNGGGIPAIVGATDFKLNTGSDPGLAPDLPFAASGVEPPDNGFVLDLPLASPIPAVLGPTLFFCIPKNDKLLGYWDTVADRLFKIRHCMNIEGVVRQLALFAPPIDPGLLVKAAAAGLDIAAVLSEAQKHQVRSNAIEMARAAFGFLPDFDIGIEGGFSSPTVKGRWGGSNILSYMSAVSQAFAMDAHRATHEAGKALTEAGYERRQEDWDFQAAQARAEIEQIEKQIIAAEIRMSIAEQDLKSHELQVENAKGVDEFMRGKYTNQELYSWMISQISAVYFQSYQLAYDVAKRSERAYRYELGLAESESNFIQFGYWDSLKKGLLSGERLSHDLKRMEVAYLERNRREYEITQHFSLALLSPNALLRLREVGNCEFEIPELAFDVSYPGHYMRRIKSVSVTTPCVVGPYTNVNATLSLLTNRVRISGNSQQDYTYTGMEDPKFRHDLIGVQSIATSSGQNDSGLFQLNFQDERYLPFERAGAISRWRLSLPGEFRPFDYNTISDVILHMSYTAREGGEALKALVTSHVSNTINTWLDELADQGGGLQRLISLEREFPNELHQFLFPAQGQNLATELRMSKRYFPYFVKDRELTVSRIDLFLKPKDGETVDSDDLTLEMNQTTGSSFSMHEQVGLPFSHFALTEALSRDESVWGFEVTRGSLSADAIEDLYLLVTYQVGATQ
jgi:hypothetical protein